jgi:ubiquinone biosynthesis protein UbiJ
MDLWEAISVGREMLDPYNGGAASAMTDYQRKAIGTLVVAATALSAKALEEVTAELKRRQDSLESGAYE